MSYYRITGYYPKENICFIADSNGRFNELWEFSAYLVKLGVKIIKVGNNNKFADGNFIRAAPDKENIILRACGKGQPIINGKIIIVNGMNYIHDINL